MKETVENKCVHFNIKHKEVSENREMKKKLRKYVILK